MDLSLIVAPAGSRAAVRRARRPEAVRAFGGPGLTGTAATFDAIGLRPGDLHARATGASEILAGALLALGLLTP